MCAHNAGRSQMAAALAVAYPKHLTTVVKAADVVRDIRDDLQNRVTQLLRHLTASFGRRRG